MKVLVTEKAQREKDSLGHLIASRFDTLFGKLNSGQDLSTKDFKKLKGYKQLYEFRIKQNTNIYRAIGGMIKKDVLIVLFIKKKSNKLSLNVFNTVLKRLNQFK
ncbi:MAG: type II toxin-antitoxin system RelE/ParE family toxin [Candidatus Dojkabacteria bacterium]|nr:type II toxin-antitoxin system RelE/ParE family toxin [Candidatus Dojkabacteria bacterium]MDQ7020481.1 type II toxin-antitoxin system RelE/ParE family toxin [Candidatus Dojkabacteria bacterium]